MADELTVDIQNVSSADGIPGDPSLCYWAKQAHVADGGGDAELTIRIVDEQEGRSLNERYRHCPGSTNVLSFPFQAPPGVNSDLLGDIVICAPVVSREANEQNKSPEAHWAHMVVHGVLHLRGYDHQREQDVQAMENLETRVLAELGYSDPYQVAYG